MKLLLYVVGILFCFQGHSQHSEVYTLPGSCFVRTLPDGVKEIVLPDKTLYALFTPHLGYEPREVNRILSGKSSSKGDMEILSSSLRMFLNDHLETANRERGDVLSIVGLLRESEFNIRWIGIEASKKDMVNWTVEGNVESYHMTKDFLLEKGVLNPEETESLLYLMFYPEIIALAEYPELFYSKGVSFIPLGDDVYNEKARIVFQDLMIIRHKFSHRLQQLASIWQREKENCQDKECIDHIQRESDQTDLQMESVSSLIDILKIVPQEQIIAVLSKIRDEKLRELIRRYFAYYNQFIEYADRRSETMATLALQQPGNGFLMAGFKHEKVIIETLLSTCSP